MKRKIVFLAFLLPLLALVGCSKDKETYFGIDSATTINLKATDTKAQIKVVASNDVTWTITQAPLWCRPDPITGKGDGTVNLEVQQNKTNEPRKVVLVAVSFLGQVPITINQEAAAAAAGATVQQALENGKRQ